MFHGPRKQPGTELGPCIGKVFLNITYHACSVRISQTAWLASLSGTSSLEGRVEPTGIPHTLLNDVHVVQEQPKSLASNLP